MRIRAKWKFAAKATALGARVPQAGLSLFQRDGSKSGSARQTEDPDLYKKSLN